MVQGKRALRTVSGTGRCELETGAGGRIKVLLDPGALI